MSTALATERRYTPEELLDLPDGKSYELVRGRLLERHMGYESSRISMRLASRLDRFCEDHDLGDVLGADLGYQCFPHDPGLVRKPDVSFVRRGRLPGGVEPRGWARFRPDLAVEIVSPRDRVEELEEKLEDYRKAEVPLVWVIYPATRKAWIQRASGHVGLVYEDDELLGEDVVPGFRCRLADILPPREAKPEGPAVANGARPDADASAS